MHETTITIPGVTVERAVPPELVSLLAEHGQRAIPMIAKNREMTALAERAAQRVSTNHRLILGDSREDLGLAEESVHLIVTSPPYWNLKDYPGAEGQLGNIDSYEQFLDQLDRVWSNMLRLLVPGGRAVIVVGDVCCSRRQFGRHIVFPLHSSIQERCRKLGFDNLTPIVWHKIANAQFEVGGRGGFLGKPYEPNAIVKNDIEFILFQRKCGGYRRPSDKARLLSVIGEADHRKWFQQIWTLPGTSTQEHPAPYPVSLAERLIRMFSFVGDTVCDPFAGTGTTSLAAARWGRNSVSVEVEPTYFKMAFSRLDRCSNSQPTLFTTGKGESDEWVCA